MEEKVYIKFDLSDKEMIRKAISMPEVYEDMLVYLISGALENSRWYHPPDNYENEFMVVSFI